MENIFIPEATIQKQKINERHLLWHCTPILGSSVG